jgi:hypothetical protein
VHYAATALQLSHDFWRFAAKSLIRVTRDSPQPATICARYVAEVTMQKTVLVFGLIAGAILSVLMSIGLAFHDQLGFDKAEVVGYTNMVAAFLMVYFGIRSYRDNVAGGSVSFGRAFVVGLLISLIATVCYVAVWEVIYFNFMPDYLDKYAAYALEKAKASGATAAQIAAKARDFAEFKEMYRNPFINFAMTALEPLPVGLLFTLVSAFALSRRRAGTEVVQE